MTVLPAAHGQASICNMGPILSSLLALVRHFVKVLREWGLANMLADYVCHGGGVGQVLCAMKAGSMHKQVVV